MMGLNPLLWLRLGAAAAIFGAGLWTGVQFEEGARDSLIRSSLEQARDQAQAELEAERRNHAASLEAVTGFLEAQVATAKGKLRYETIIRYVPAESDCIVPEPAVRLLEAHRQGLPGDTPGAAGSPTSGPEPQPLPLTRLIEADADLADLYRLCRIQIQAIGLAVGH